MQPTLESTPGGRVDDAALENDLETLARLMDSAFRVPGVGIRFGLDAIVGLIPGFGDTVTSLVSLYILTAASRYGVPRVALARMALNLGIDYVLGAVPLLGDFFDVYWKANQRNVALLRRHLLATPVAERRARAGDWLFVGGLCLVLLLVLLASMAFTVLLASRIVAWLWNGHG